MKQETTPGTVISMSQSDILVQIEDGAQPTWDFERIQSEEVQGTSSRRPGLTGRRLASMALSYWLRGSTSLSTAAIASQLFESAMLKRSQVRQVTSGSVTGGPFENGETITGGTSAATGRVFRNRSSSPILYVPITGSFTSGEVITGGTSGATATTSSTPSDQGYVYEPKDSDFEGSESKHHVSFKLLQDGFFWEGRGCLSDLNFEFKNGHPARLRQTISGAYSSHGDQALYSGVTYPESAVTPPRFSNISLTLGAYAPRDIVEMTFSIPTDPQPREDANNASDAGILYADYLKAEPTLSFDPAMVKAATKDYFTELKEAGTFAVTWKLTGTAGNNWDFFADEAQFIEVGTGDRRGIALAPLRIGLYGTNNDEFAIWQH